MNDLNFLYDQTIEYMARLYGFLSTAGDDWVESSETSEDIEHVAQLLVRRDLLLFAVTLRNFAESAFLTDYMKKMPVLDSEVFLAKGPPCFREKKSSVNLYRVTSRVLHSTNIRIHRRPEDYIILEHASDVAKYYVQIQEYKNKFDVADGKLFEPLLIVSTESDGSYHVSLRRLLRVASIFLDFAYQVLEKKQLLYRKSFRDM